MEDASSSFSKQVIWQPPVQVLVTDNMEDSSSIFSKQVIWQPPVQVSVTDNMEDSSSSFSKQVIWQPPCVTWVRADRGYQQTHRCQWQFHLYRPTLGPLASMISWNACLLGDHTELG